MFIKDRIFIYDLPTCWLVKFTTCWNWRAMFNSATCFWSKQQPVGPPSGKSEHMTWQDLWPLLQQSYYPSLHGACHAMPILSSVLTQRGWTHFMHILDWGTSWHWEWPWIICWPGHPPIGFNCIFIFSLFHPVSPLLAFLYP